jgi:hypothetical protein
MTDALTPMQRVGRPAMGWGQGFTPKHTQRLSATRSIIE